MMSRAFPAGSRRRRLAALGPDAVGEAKAEVAAAGADVGDDGSFLDFEDLHELAGAFLILALGPFEPTGGLMAHDLGNLAIHVELADAVGIMVGTHHVARRIGGEQRAAGEQEDAQGPASTGHGRVSGVGSS